MYPPRTCGRVHDVEELYGNVSEAQKALSNHIDKRKEAQCVRLTVSVEEAIQSTTAEIEELCEQVMQNNRENVWDELGDVLYGIHMYEMVEKWQAEKSQEVVSEKQPNEASDTERTQTDTESDSDAEGRYLAAAAHLEEQAAGALASMKTPPEDKN
jgi:NTP pyrophosphatase (non-canonical NTP hydrolase)